MRTFIEKLESYKEIIFGPFLGSYEIEVSRWSPFVKWYIKENPTKKIIISTRYERKDLYYGITPFLDTFNLEGDGIKYIPKDFYIKNIPQEMFDKLVSGIKVKYPNAYMFHPFDLGSNINIISEQYRNYEYNIVENPKMILDSIQNDKINICIASCFNSDECKYSLSNYNTLFQLLDNSQKFNVYVIGKSPNYMKPKESKLKTILDTEDLVSSAYNITHSGIAIESIRRSKLVIGIQNGNIILSNLMKVPTLTWGNDNNKYTKFENPLHTHSIYLIDKFKNIPPLTIFNNVRRHFGMKIN